MEKEETKQPVETVEKPLEEKPLSMIEEARKLNEQMITTRDEIKAEREALEKVKAENMLSGTAGGHVETEEKKETPKEYAERTMKGE